MKVEVGKAPSTPDYPADPALDDTTYPIVPATNGKHTPPEPVLGSGDISPVPGRSSAENVEATSDPHTESAIPVPDAGKATEPHRIVLATRKTLGKSRTSDRVAVGGRGHFRLLAAPTTGERACSIIDRLVEAAEQRGWAMKNTDKGYVVLADEEPIGFMIEEKLDRIAHVVTAGELKEKAEYDRKCALADRGIGYRPWRPAAIPEHDYVPNGELVLKFDHDYDAGGTRRTFSDGKRQRLEDLVPSMIDSLERWSVAVKAKREERAQWKRDWEEQERRRKDHERQIRVEGYRITFLQRQVERKREIDGLARLIGIWEQAVDPDPKFAELLDFAHLYRKWLEAKLAPGAVAERIADLKLMDDDVYIYDAKRLD